MRWRHARYDELTVDELYRILALRQAYEMCAPGGAMTVEHGRQQHDLDLLAKHGQRFGSTLRDRLPL